jgi:hypothetical protein
MLTPAEAVRTYILAKDGNRPFLMQEAFTSDAQLETVVKTDVISFPRTADGLSALEDILVRRFCVDYENIFTFCLSEPSVADSSRFQCHWLVGMSVKNTGQLRVGCGRYDWHLTERQGAQACNHRRCHEGSSGERTGYSDVLAVFLAVSLVPPGRGSQRDSGASGFGRHRELPETGWSDPGDAVDRNRR